jgi:hypothetical protein
MSYGHAHELLASGEQNPVVPLRTAVAKLKAWADLNPRLQPLYLEFETSLRLVEDHQARHGERRV